MGYMRHHTVVVTSMLDDDLDEAHSMAIELFQAENMVRLVSPIVAGIMNGYRSFFIAPDGSKEFWDHSDRAERARKKFVEWLADQRYSDGSSAVEWVEVQFGDDDRVTKVLRDSDEALRSNDDRT